MSDGTNGAPERFAIGISFGNTSSSIARINPVCEPDSRPRIYFHGFESLLRQKKVVLMVINI